jgi:hypothetical protein
VCHYLEAKKMQTKVSWIGIAAGVSTLVLIAVSLFVPWWRFTAGTPPPRMPYFAEVNFSPINLNFYVNGTPINIPLIWAMNMVTLLSLLAGGIIMLIYSVLPAKPYAKKLLRFGYNKPLMAVILFVVELVVLSLSTKAIVGVNFPLMGSAILRFPQSIIGTEILANISVAAMFQWPFYFAIGVTALCVAARLYHGKLMRSPPPPLEPQYIASPPPPMMAEQR